MSNYRKSQKWLIFLLVLSAICTTGLKILPNSENLKMYQIPHSNQSSYNYKGVFTFEHDVNGAGIFAWYENPPYQYDYGAGEVISGYNQHNKVYQIIGTYTGPTMKHVTLGTCTEGEDQVVEVYLCTGNSSTSTFILHSPINEQYSVSVTGDSWTFHYNNTEPYNIGSYTQGEWVHVKYKLRFSEDSVEIYLNNVLKFSQFGVLSKGEFSVSFGDMGSNPAILFMDSLSYTWDQIYNEGDLLLIDSTVSTTDFTTTTSNLDNPFLPPTTIIPISFVLIGLIAFIFIIGSKKRKQASISQNQIQTAPISNPAVVNVRGFVPGRIKSDANEIYSAPSYQKLPSSKPIAEILCRFCGKPNSMNDNFCSECGHSLK